MATQPPDRDHHGTNLVSKLRDWFSGGGQRIVKPTGSAIADKGKLPAQLAYAQRAQNATPASDTKTRAQRAEEHLAIFNNQLRPLVVAKLKEQFHPDNFARMALMPNEWTNPLRRIVDELSILYESPAQRRLVVAEEEEKPAPKKKTKLFGLDDDEEETGTVSEEGDDYVADDEEEEGDDDAEAPAPGEGAPVSPEDIGTGDPEVDELADVLEALDVEKTEDEETPFEKVMRLADLDVVMDKVEKLTRILPVVWVRPYVRAEGEVDVVTKLEDGTETTEKRPDPKASKLEFIIYTPDKAWIVADPVNRTQAMAFCYWGDEFDPTTGEIRQVIHFWNRQTYWKLDAEWKFLDSHPNPYGTLPVVEFRADLPVTDYYLDGMGQDLAAATIELCVWRTLENTRGRDAGFKQLAMVGVNPEDIPSDQVMGGPTPIYAGEGGSVSVLDMQPHLDQFTNTIEKRSLELASNHGISGAEYKQEGAPQSGFAKRLDRDKILRENRRIRKFFAESEKKLYRLLAVTLAEHPIAGVGKLDPDAEFEIDFAEPTFAEDPQTQARTDALDLKLNKTSIIDILRRENPDLSDAELVRRAYRNKRINEVLMSTEQNRLVDILATRAIAGASLDGGGGPGGGGATGDEGEEGEQPSSPGAKGKPPAFGGKPFGGGK